MQAYLIPPRGARQNLNKDSFTVSELQDLVDGWIDVVPVAGGVLVFDADGQEKDKYMNFEATRILRTSGDKKHLDDYVAGVAVFCPEGAIRN